MAVLGPKIIFFFSKILALLCLLIAHLNFSRLATLPIVLCVYVSMHQFILFSLAHVNCTLYNVHLS